MSERPVYILSFQARPEGAPPACRIRRLLKVALSLGLKCVRAEESTGQPIDQSEPKAEGTPK